MPAGGNEYVYDNILLETYKNSKLADMEALMTVI
jgi:hypothetical protein